MTISRSNLRRLVIREMYNTKLVNLYEQAPPTPTPAPAPAAAPAADAGGMFEEPAAPAAPPPDAGAAAGAPPAGATPPATPAIPPVPSPAAPAAAPGVPTPPTPGVPGATPTPPPGAATAGETAKKSAKAPDPVKEPGKSEVNKAFTKAMAAATESEDGVATESLRRRSLRFLFEQEDKQSKIDMSVYAGEIAKLIKNYTSLVDIKKNVITQAEEYLDNDFPKESEELKKQLKDLLRKDYHISLERPEAPPDSYAVGAGAGGGGGAG